MHCYGRCAGVGTPSGVLRGRRSAVPHAITALSRPSKNVFSSRDSVSRLPRKQRKCSKIASQASSSSQASVILRAPSGAQQAALQQQDMAVPRSVLIAIDYTSDAEQALQWALDFVVKPGDQVTLVHVISNPRASSTDGGYRGGLDFQEVQDMRNFVKRLKKLELQKIGQRFQPMLQAADVSYEVKLPMQKGQKSAQAIGEALCQTAQELKAAILIIASHGTGVLADYGSVANYCSQNSKAPVLMVPPNVASLQTKQPGHLMVVALANFEGLQTVAYYTLKNLYQPGDIIHTTYVEDSAGADVIPSQHGLSDQMEEAVKEWFTEGQHGRVNYDINIMTAPAPLESSDLDLGEEICAKADELQARVVVLLHHGKGMVKEMIYGSITSFATRNCKRPLIVYYGDQGSNQ
ncbi:hypothetical protein ABBQ38_009807 [Trebouxia sp. C0009 RCD-2024]